ncbi:fimbria/pilus outer membrane usher protein [[Erwinia] mediterraneensis]|uniref:fimbria/pilus outer membrane usher protein n=1 Tax=[Erwinia] mediterraneensis TaxID=2161819 RepID=UPI0010317432|nr:fimbria/pilus outer membrane usher protein [[Erwinia] mediterraneensis]
MMKLTCNMERFSTVNDIFRIRKSDLLLCLAIFPLETLYAEPAVVRSDIQRAVKAAKVDDEFYEFDSELLVGTASKKKSLKRFSQKNAFSPGNYISDIFVNESYLTRRPVRFMTTQTGAVLPCLPADLFNAGAIVLKPEAWRDKNHGDCFFVQQHLKDSRTEFDVSSQKLAILIPQALIARADKNGAALNNLSAGETALFTNYDANYYFSDAKYHTSHAAWFSFSSGINFGLWQWRHQGNASWYQQKNGINRVRWQPLQTYVQRPLVTLGSQLTLGEIFTSGKFFSGLGLNGIRLETDQRMKASPQRGYAPVIRGMAATTAKVTLRQVGKIIYQTTVSPGNFSVDDLPATNYQGDIDVTVDEADGRHTSFTVPFSSVPDSLRMGDTRYSFVAGKTRNFSASNAFFTDLIWRSGLTNQTTVSSGLRLSPGYLSLPVGGVYSSAAGAFGFEAAWSTASIAAQPFTGWRLGSSWSRTFNAGATSVALAGYRYSGGGYREFSDVLGLREAARKSKTWYSHSYQQSSQLTLSLNQSLHDYGNLWVAGSRTFYQQDARQLQLQLGYSHHWRQLSYDFSFSRQYQGARHYGLNSDSDYNRPGAENRFLLSFSLPLGNSTAAPAIASSLYYRPDAGGTTAMQSSVSGVLGDQYRSSYSLNASWDGQQQGNSIGAAISHQFPAATASSTLSLNRAFLQSSVSLRGSMVAHAGGLTFGPYTSETFALIEAQGAEGATLASGMGATVDRAGYAIYPSVIPYSYNDIALEAKTMRDPYRELNENQKKVAGYAGAMLKVRFKTRRGYPLLIKLRNSDAVALNADVIDENDNVVGLVGQSYQIYARVSQPRGILWAGKDRTCRIPYSLELGHDKQPLYRLEASCQRD